LICAHRSQDRGSFVVREQSPKIAKEGQIAVDLQRQCSAVIRPET
jgi:hypothetical protein